MANCRKSDTAARVGGEEMSIIVTGETLEETQILAERIRSTIESSVCAWQGEEIRLTASFGIAFATAESDSAWQIYQHADEALYRAKNNGRNQVCLYTP